MSRLFLCPCTCMSTRICMCMHICTRFCASCVQIGSLAPRGDHEPAEHEGSTGASRPNRSSSSGSSALAAFRKEQTAPGGLVWFREFRAGCITKRIAKPRKALP